MLPLVRTMIARTRILDAVGATSPDDLSLGELQRVPADQRVAGVPTGCQRLRHSLTDNVKVTDSLARWLAGWIVPEWESRAAR